ncbi:hypothetical protein SO802_017284 [Lithocarpus litseifolius]|uniref:Macro domain-containing protein n=1 Tax=Lithocarpus litseifolius TaxID=425828 RepID=A0AAW2D1E4_9ROSI
MSSTWCRGRSLLIASRTLKATPTPTPTKTIITSSTLNPNPTSTTFHYRTRLTHSSPPFSMAATSSTARVSNEGGDGVVRFPLSPSAALVIQKGDITKWFVDSKTDAIVNPANEQMLGGGGADGAIHRAAGPDLLQACYKVPEVRPGVRCPTGEARITPGFKLPASHVIHTVGPMYNADSNPQASLRNAYRNSLSVAKENSIQYIAFPAISCGVYGYPFDEAATVAISTVKESSNDFKEVHFVLFSPDIYNVWLNKANEVLKD